MSAATKLYELPNGSFLEVPEDASDAEVLKFANSGLTEKQQASTGPPLQPSHVSTVPNYELTPQALPYEARPTFPAASVGPAPERPMWGDAEPSMVQTAIQKAMPWVPWGLLPDPNAQIPQAVEYARGGAINTIGDQIDYLTNAAPQGFRDVADLAIKAVNKQGLVPPIPGYIPPLDVIYPEPKKTEPGYLKPTDAASEMADYLHKRGKEITEKNIRRKAIEEPYDSHKVWLEDPKHALLTGIEGIGPTLATMGPALAAAYITGGTTPVAALTSAVVSRALESSAEGGQIIGEMQNEGKTTAEAVKAANKVFGANMGLVGADAVEMGLILLPMPETAKKLIAGAVGRLPGYMGTVAAKAFVNAFMEGQEEGLQTEIQKWGKGEEFTLNPLKFDPQSVRAGELNAFMMGGPVAAVTESRAVLDKHREIKFQKMVTEAKEALKVTDPEAAKVLETMRSAKRARPTENQVMTARFEEAPEWMPVQSDLRSEWAQGKLEKEDIATRPDLGVPADKALADLEVAEAKVKERLGPLDEGLPPEAPAGFEPGVENEATRAIDDIKKQLLKAATKAEAKGLFDKAQSLRHHASQIFPSNPQDPFHVALAEFGASRGMGTVYIRTAEDPPIGGYLRTPGVVVIRENLSHPEAAVASMLHEMQHQFEAKHPDVWLAMVDEVKTAFPEKWEQAEKSIPGRYFEEAGVELEKEGVQSEVMAEFIEKRATGVLTAIGKRGIKEYAAKTPGPIGKGLEWIGDWMRSFARFTGKKLAGKNERTFLGKTGRRAQLWGLQNAPAIDRNAAQLALDMATHLETLKGPMRADVDIASWETPTKQQPPAPIPTEPTLPPSQSPPESPLSVPSPEPAAAAAAPLAEDRRSEWQPRVSDEEWNSWTDKQKRERFEDLEYLLRTDLRLRALGVEIPNWAAFQEFEGNVVVALDVDSLKWFNDKLGEIDGGDVLLASVLGAMVDVGDQMGVKVARVGGDEAAAVVANAEEAREFAVRLEKELRSRTLRYTLKTGGFANVQPQATTATGSDYKTASGALKLEKDRREAAGLRAPRGREPIGIQYEDAPGSRDSEGRESESVPSSELEKPSFPRADRRVLSEEEIPDTPDYEILPRWLAARPWLAKPWMNDELTNEQVIDELSEGKNVTALRRKKGLRELVKARKEYNALMGDVEALRTGVSPGLKREESLTKKIRRLAFRGLYLKQTVMIKGKHRKKVPEDHASIAASFRTNRPTAETFDEFHDRIIREGHAPASLTEDQLVEILSGPGPKYQVQTQARGPQAPPGFIESEEKRIRRLMNRVDRAYKNGDLQLAERLDVRLESQMADFENVLAELDEDSLDQAEEVYIGKGPTRFDMSADDHNVSDRSQSDVTDLLALIHAQMDQGSVDKEDAVYAIRDILWSAAVAQLEDSAVKEKMRALPAEVALDIAKDSWQFMTNIRAKLPQRKRLFQVSKAEKDAEIKHYQATKTDTIEAVDKGKYTLIQLSERDAESLLGVGVPRGWTLTWPNRHLINRDLFNKGVPASAMPAVNKALQGPRTALVQRHTKYDDIKITRLLARSKSLYETPDAHDIRLWVMIGRSQMIMEYPKLRRRKNGPGWEEEPRTGFQPAAIPMPRFQIKAPPYDLPGMYSALHRTIESNAQQKWQPKQLLAWVKNQPGIKAEEIEWSGIEEFLQAEGDNVTREKVLNFLNNNGVKVKEVLHGGMNSDEIWEEDRSETGPFGRVYQEGDGWFFDVGPTRIGPFDSILPAIRQRRERINEYFEEKIGPVYREGDYYFFTDGTERIGGFLTAQGAHEVRQERAVFHKDQLPTKYENYTLGGGINYKELLLIIDRPKMSDKDIDRHMDLEDRIDDLNAEEQDEYDLLDEKVDYTFGSKGPYHSTHWDQPNVLAHVRFNERQSNRRGEPKVKVLFLEEIQSDWHQEGRRENYGNREIWTVEGKKGNVYGEYHSESEAREALIRIGNNLSSYEVDRFGPSTELQVVNTGRTKKSDFPDAPFKGNAWVNLAIKRMVRWAVENDFDTVAWTTGAQQADRYDLSREVDEINYNPETQIFVANKGERGTPEHRRIVNEEMVTKEKLVDYIGKELAQRLLAQEPNVNGLLTLSGVELKIGGVGMKTFYDTTLRNLVQKLYKKYDVKVEPIQMMIHMSLGGVVNSPRGDVHGFKITDSLRNGVMKGQPLFQVRAMANEPGAPQFRDGAPGWTLPPETWLDARRRLIQDKFIRVKTLQQTIEKATGVELPDELNTYLLEERYYGIVKDRVDRIEEELIEPLIRRLRKLRVSPEQLEEYLYARHAPERNQYLYEIHYDRPVMNINRETGEIERNRSYSEGYKKQLLTKQRAKLDALFKMQDEKRIPNSGMTDRESDEIIQRFKAEGLLAGEEKVRIVGDQRRASTLSTYMHTGKLADLAKMFDRIVLRKLEILAAEGLETEQAIHNVAARYDYYVPLKGRELEGDLEDLVGDVEATPGKGFDIRGLELEHSLGRRKRAKNPILAQAVLDLEETIIRAEKNKVGESFLSLVEANPNPDLWEVNKVVKKYVYDPQLKQAVSVVDKFKDLKPWVLSVKREGVENYIHMKDARLASAMKNLGSASSGAFVQFVGTGTRFLAAVNTSMNLEFVFANFTRDLQTAAINLSAEDTQSLAIRIGRDVLPAIVGIEASLYGKEAGKYSKIYEDYKKSGAAIGFFGLESIEDRSRTIAKQWRRAGTNMAARGWNAAAGLGSLIGNINEAVENGVRLATYHHAREAGLSDLKAASLARNLTVNFNRKGEIGQTANALYMFANAGVQGSTRLLSAARHSPRVRRVLGGIVATSYGLAMYNRAIGGQDDDGEWMWDKVPQYVKDRNIVVMVPGGENWITFPAPYGYNVMLTTGNTLEALTASARGIGREKSAVEAALDIGDSAIGAFNPLGDARLTTMHGIGTAIAPTLMDPILDLIGNETFYGSPIHPEQPQFGASKPRSELKWRSVSRISDKLATSLNEWAGGNEMQPGEIFGRNVSISPEVIDYIAAVIFGGAGQTIMNTSGSIVDLAFGRERRVGKIPFIRRFLGEQTEFHVPGVYRDTVDRITQAENALKHIREERPHEEDGWMERYGDLVPLFEIKKDIAKQISAARKDDDAETVVKLQKELNAEYRRITEER